MVVYFLLWFQFINNDLHYYQLSQFSTEAECFTAKETAQVLVTDSTITVECFEVKPGV
tara:strand:- start:483 stop:656 length:174 start_codon:yes stop_codon:yes gene_type:complete